MRRGCERYLESRQVVVEIINISQIKNIMVEIAIITFRVFPLIVSGNPHYITPF